MGPSLRAALMSSTAAFSSPAYAADMAHMPPPGPDRPSWTSRQGGFIRLMHWLELMGGRARKSEVNNTRGVRVRSSGESDVFFFFFFFPFFLFFFLFSFLLEVDEKQSTRLAYTRGELVNGRKTPPCATYCSCWRATNRPGSARRRRRRGRRRWRVSGRLLLHRPTRQRRLRHPRDLAGRAEARGLLLHRPTRRWRRRRRRGGGRRAPSPTHPTFLPTKHSRCPRPLRRRHRRRFRRRPLLLRRSLPPPRRSLQRFGSGYGSVR